MITKTELVVGALTLIALAVAIIGLAVDYQRWSQGQF